MSCGKDMEQPWFCSQCILIPKEDGEVNLRDLNEHLDALHIKILLVSSV